MEPGLRRQRLVAGAVIGTVTIVSLVTGSLWPIAVDHGGDTSRNPIGRYGPHWLYPVVVAVALAVLLWVLIRSKLRVLLAAALSLFAAGAASNLLQWLVLGGVRNPIGPLPDVHGSGHASIGDACLTIGVVVAVVAMVGITDSPKNQQDSGIPGAS